MYSTLPYSPKIAMILALVSTTQYSIPSATQLVFGDPLSFKVLFHPKNNSTVLVYFFTSQVFFSIASESQIAMYIQ